MKECFQFQSVWCHFKQRKSYTLSIHLFSFLSSASADYQPLACLNATAIWNETLQRTDSEVMMILDGTNNNRSPWRRLCVATRPLSPESTRSSTSFCCATPSFSSQSPSREPFSKDWGSHPQLTLVLFLSTHNPYQLFLILNRIPQLCSGGCSRFIPALSQ